MGTNTTANGDFSTVLGTNASDDYNGGVFVFGDNSTTSVLRAANENEFDVRAAGGVNFYTSSNLSTGVSFPASGGITTGISPLPGHAGSTGSLTFVDADSMHQYTTTFTAGSQSANVSYTLPTAAPSSSGQMLASTTAGVMSWTTAATGATAVDYDVNSAQGGNTLSSTGTNNLFNVSYGATPGNKTDGAVITSITSGTNVGATGLTITASAGGTNGGIVNALILSASGGSSASTTYDIYGTSGNWSVLSSGALTTIGLVTANAGITASGAAVNLNASSNNNTNINTGTSTGTATIGNSGATVAVNGTTSINANVNDNTNINTGTSTGTVAIGSAGSTTSIIGAVTINGGGSAQTNIGTGSTGLVSIGSTGSAINLRGALELTNNAGTSGQVLTSAGTGATPTWTSVPTGSGTEYSVPVWNNAGGTTLGNSSITDNGSTVGVTNGESILFSGTSGVTPTSNSGTLFEWIPAKSAFLAGNGFRD